MTTTRSRLAKRLTTTLNIANSNLIVIIIATTKIFSKLINGWRVINGTYNSLFFFVQLYFNGFLREF